MLKVNVQMSQMYFEYVNVWQFWNGVSNNALISLFL